MTKIYIVEVMNRFNNDMTDNKYFTAKENAVKYAEKINARYNEAEKAKKYAEMVYHVDMRWGIKEVAADEED